MSFVAALAHNRIVFGTFRIVYQPSCGLLDYWYETRSTLSSCQFAALTINILTHVPSHVIATLITSKKPAALPVTHQTSHIALFVLILRYRKLRFSPSFRQQGMIIGKGGESIKVPSWVMGCKASKNPKMWQLNFVDFSFLRCQTEFLGCFWECSFGCPVLQFAFGNGSNHDPINESPGFLHMSQPHQRQAMTRDTGARIEVSKGAGDRDSVPHLMRW